MSTRLMKRDMYNKGDRAPGGRATADILGSRLSGGLRRG